MTLVSCNGCFDGLHKGHMFFLGFCAGLGDTMVVWLNSDKYIQQVKGITPLYSECDRVKMIQDLGIVSHVSVFDSPTPEHLLRACLPDIHVTGQDDVLEEEAALCTELGIRLVLVPRIGSWSSTALRLKN